MHHSLINFSSHGLNLKQLQECICFLKKTKNFWLHKMLNDGLEWCGLLWCFYQLVGLSFWRHPFTAENPSVSKWCNVIHFTKSDAETNSSTSWKPGDDYISVNVLFWGVNYSIRLQKCFNALNTSLGWIGLTGYFGLRRDRETWL